MSSAYSSYTTVAGILSRSKKISLGVGLGIGLPTAIVAIVKAVINLYKLQQQRRFRLYLTR